MDNVRYKARYEELENHNKQLEQGMREIMTALKEKNGKINSALVGLKFKWTQTKF